MCQVCATFLYDFLKQGTPNQTQLTKQIRMKSLQKILPEFADWIHRVHNKIDKKNYHTAVLTANRIARRGRPIHEYDYLIHTATFNFLKFSLPWINPEVDYMKVLLIEAGCLVGKNYVTLLRHAQDYISYILPKVMVVLNDLHDDHVHPKGLYTDVGKMFIKKEKIPDTDTCFDKEDYMSEVLESEDDLYA